MEQPRPFALVRTVDQWLRATHTDTSLDASGVVALAWETPAPTNNPGTAPIPGGLAFDVECRLYHSVPTEGRVERAIWAAAPGTEPIQPLLPSEPPPAPPSGTFAPNPPPPNGLHEPRALAVDGSDRLFVAETGAKRLLVYDLWSFKLLRKLPLGARPLDLASDGRGVWVLLDTPALLYLEARRHPLSVGFAQHVVAPFRLALRPGGATGIAGLANLFVLDHPAAGTLASVVPQDPALAAYTVDRATDLEFDGGGALVVARHPGEDFLRDSIAPGQRTDLPPLKARGYDGQGIVRTPDGNIGYWTQYGFRQAIVARLRYAASGEVTTFRLDSGAYQTEWGRLFLDACIPEHTDVRVRCIATDESPEGPTIPYQQPVNRPLVTIARPDLSPPLLPAELDVGPVDDALYRRDTGRELPWVRVAADDKFETYEAPILAGRGRYLWVTIALSGDTARTPRVRCLRAEYPTHDWVRRLPKTFSRDDAQASFLRRYLAIFEGAFGELEAKAVARLALVDAAAAPPELLPWLAGFIGLVLDERWRDDQKRTLVAEAADLFRFRGTNWALQRYLEIYLDGAPLNIIEQFRLRGVGGALGSAGGAVDTRSVLGAGFRIGGEIGAPGSQILGGANLADAFASNAHRFTVIVATTLSAEQRAVVEQILAVHRPAHTIAQVCGVDAGMRVGRGLLVGLSSVIGRTGGFSTAQVGQWTVGRGGGIVGRPMPGFAPGGSRVGRDSRVG